LIHAFKFIEVTGVGVARLWSSLHNVQRPTGGADALTWD
jgi:hypothetical protein